MMLRIDRVGSYGASRDTTPQFDALAKSSVRFERAYATAVEALDFASPARVSNSEEIERLHELGYAGGDKE